MLRSNVTLVLVAFLLGYVVGQNVERGNYQGLLIFLSFLALIPVLMVGFWYALSKVFPSVRDYFGW